LVLNKNMTSMVYLRSWEVVREGAEFLVSCTKDGVLGPIQFCATVRANSEESAQNAMNAKADIIYNAMIQKPVSEMTDHDSILPRVNFAFPSLVEMSARLVDVENRQTALVGAVDALTHVLLSYIPSNHQAANSLLAATRKSVGLPDITQPLGTIS